MAKVPFTKLYTKEDLGKIKTFTWNEQEIEVKQYLSLEGKKEILQNIINFVGESDFLDAVTINSCLDLLITMGYTNVSFTDKQLNENILKTIDMLTETDFVNEVKNYIPTDEINGLRDNIYITLNYLFNYRNSFASLAKEFNKNNTNVENELEDLEKVVQQLKENPELINLTHLLQEDSNEGTKQENENIIKLNNK